VTRQRGFTLPEFLVALLIFSLIASATVFALRLGVEARDQLDEAGRRLGDLHIARLIIKEDMAHLVARPVRDEFGSPAGPPFRGGIEAVERNARRDETRLLVFVRAGWANPGADSPRSTLQYVEYVAKGGALIRRTRPYLDDARNQQRFDSILLRDADDVELTFLAGEVRGALEWASAWPLAGRAAAAPRAISVASTSARYGRIEQRFWIGALGDSR
jgi:general secretion pathway protein J